MADEKKKVVALLSGGLDSQLAVRMMQEQGFDVSAVAIKTPFCDFDCGRGCGFEIRERADDLNVNLKTVIPNMVQVQVSILVWIVDL
jgi:tRNA U34 2-thiouridine synthase MnmA/TrmU